MAVCDRCGTWCNPYCGDTPSKIVDKYRDFDVKTPEDLFMLKVFLKALGQSDSDFDKLRPSSIKELFKMAHDAVSEFGEQN